MKTVLIRECTHHDIDEILQLDIQWDQENIAHEFDLVSREEFIANLERFQTYFLVAENDGRIIGYVNGTVRLGQGVAVIPEQERYLEYVQMFK